MWYVYVLQKARQWYVGYTSNVERRYQEHRTTGDWQLLYYEAYCDERTARKRERQLKHYGSAWRALKSRIDQHSA